jgi:excisionase family DNA binding protein
MDLVTTYILQKIIAQVTVCLQHLPQEMGMEFKELMSVGDAARRLGGISKWTVYAWLSQGKLARVKVGSRTMISEFEIERFLTEGQTRVAGQSRPRT